MTIFIVNDFGDMLLKQRQLVLDPFADTMLNTNDFLLVRGITIPMDFTKLLNAWRVDAKLLESICVLAAYQSIGFEQWYRADVNCTCLNADSAGYKAERCSEKIRDSQRTSIYPDDPGVFCVLTLCSKQELLCQ